MIKKIVEGYGNLFNTFGKIIALVVACAALGAAFVFPLWKFATEAPRVYTIAVLSALVAAAVFVCAKKMAESGIRKFTRGLSKAAVVALGIALCVKFVLDGNRILAIPTIIATIALYGVISFGFKKAKSN